MLKYSIPRCYSEKKGENMKIGMLTQGGGSPCPYDRVISSRFGAAAQMIQSHPL